MKQISTLFFAGMLMSAPCVAFVACNKPNGLGQKDPLEGVGIAPVPETEVPKEVTAFFEENPAGSIFKLEFDQTEEKSTIRYA